MNKKVAFYTLGCRLNISESGSIADGFKQRGYEVVDFETPADVVFLNTCTVTDSADSSCRNLIRRAQKHSPEGKIAVAGCYAQMNPQEIAKMQGVDLILGNSEKYKVFDYLQEEEQEIIHCDQTNEFWGANTTLADSHTRAFLKIQDGCNYICSFCIIPFARGRSRAMGIAEAVQRARELIASGFKEIVLTGVNIGEYENNTGERLSQLLREILNLEGLERLRLSSVEPNTITDDLLEVMQSSPKFMDHFHIPLQSGDDQILTSMRRKYSVEKYREVMAKIKKAFPRAAIGADIIVGYPGESEEQFQNTYQLLEELPITHFHVFPYSKRKNTTAAKLPHHLPHAVKKQRVALLNQLGAKKLQAFAQALEGGTEKILFERRQEDGSFEGYTSHYVRVKVLDQGQNLNLANQIEQVRVKSAQEGKLLGELLF